MEELSFDTVKKVLSENKIQRFLMMLLGITCASISFNLFLLPNDIVFGGVSGISIIVNNFIPMSTSLFVLIADIILLMISFIFLGKERTNYSICGSILFPIILYLTSGIENIISFSNNDILLSCIIGGVMYGFGAGLTLKAGYSTGGTDIIKLMLSKYLKISLGNATLIADGLIILAGGLVFGINKLMYAIIIIYTVSILTDKVLLGTSDKKAFYIITEKQEEISDFIIEKLHHNVTVLEAKGGNSNTKNPVLFTVIPTKEYFKFKQGINSIDKDAFWTVIDAYEVIGGD